MPIPDEIKKYIYHGFQNKDYLKEDRNNRLRIAGEGVDNSLYKKTITFFKDNPDSVNETFGKKKDLYLIQYAVFSPIKNFLKDVISIRRINLNVQYPDRRRTVLYTVIDFIENSENVLEIYVTNAKLLVEAGAKVDNINELQSPEDNIQGQSTETELDLMKRKNSRLTNKLLTLLTEKNFSTPEAYQEFRQSMDVPSRGTTMSESASTRNLGNERGASNW